jgi:aminopeptidase C
LACIAFSDIRDYVKFDGKKITFKDFDELTDRQARAIESIRQTKHGIELRLHGKSWTIDRISKILGFDAVKMMNVKLEDFSEEDLDKIIERKFNKK